MAETSQLILFPGYQIRECRMTVPGKIMITKLQNCRVFIQLSLTQQRSMLDVDVLYDLRLRNMQLNL